MGAPVITTEKLVGGNETPLALEALQRVLVSGVYTGEGREEGKTGNEKVRISERELSGGKRAWIADSDDLEKIDISNPSEISQVSVSSLQYSLLCYRKVHVYNILAEEN